jgi:D-alanine transfer protein
MKKIGFFLVGLLVFFTATYSSLFAINKYYDNKVKALYFDNIGDEISVLKNEGLILQSISVEKKDNVQIYGSSELGTTDIYTHPSNMFKNKTSGFQVNLVGRGHSQSITDAIEIAAADENLRDRTMVIILSPQWFSASNMDQSEFEMNFSELQFYSVMMNKNIGSDIKLSLASRVAQLTKGSKNYGIAYQYARLYSNNNLLSKIGEALLTPYSKLRYYLLSIKDKVQSYNYLVEMASKRSIENSNKNINYDWGKELEKASLFAKDKTNNNDFGIENNYFDTNVKNNLTATKGIDKGQSYSISPEYDDLKLLLEICKNKGVNPIFVSIPVQGKWYDYIDFSKEDRQNCYKKINNLITSYNFQLLDLSTHEYDEHFLKDTMHLGWKGWIYIDKAIDEHYHNNKYNSQEK